MKIIVVEHGQGFQAFMFGNASVCGFGFSKKTAIGDMVVKNPEYFMVSFQDLTSQPNYIGSTFTKNQTVPLY